MTFLNYTFQDPSPLISYSPGQWVEGSSTNDSHAADYSGGSFKVTSDAGSTATLSFVGTSITIFGAKRPNHGSYSVALDDGPEFVGNGNGDNIFQFPLWNAQNLSNTQHSVVMTNLPTHRGKFLDIDFISIGRELGPPGFTGEISEAPIDDGSPFVVYKGSWTNVSGITPLTAFNSTLHSTTQAGSSVSVFFQASSIELYGLYVNAPFQVSLDDQLPRDLAGPNVDLDAREEHPETLLYLADGLDENTTHVVTLTNSVSNIGRPFFFDFAIARSSRNPDPNFTIPISMLTPTPSTSANITATTSPIIRATATSMNGAIIGGIVGGVTGLLILAFIAFMLLRRSKYYYRALPPRSNVTPLLSPGGPQIRKSGLMPFISSSMRPGRPSSIISNSSSFWTGQQSHVPPSSIISSSTSDTSSSYDRSSHVASSYSTETMETREVDDKLRTEKYPYGRTLHAVNVV
ncbi:hypothetical protein Clacol_000097 [Clathrus columnatus]|uniref:Uncharacterized protein n=1 Tax=Clathrus columnatus TaxID=1419009 RepID=A0AAV4ZWL7_9AGAM|nr:hypothetical protein Clacol_000097 [Clathrus columnatus]